MNINIVIDKIKEQCNSFEVESLEYAIGEKLKELAKESDSYAELIYQDLDVENMSVKKCAKALNDYASKNQKGGKYGMSPQTAIKLIKEFYSLPDTSPVSKKTNLNVSLADLLGV